MPAWKLTIDFGPEVGIKRSSAQITHYSREELEDTLVVAVVNFPPRRIGPFSSEVLVLGALDDEKGVVLLRPDADAAPGSGSASRTSTARARRRSAAAPRVAVDRRSGTAPPADRGSARTPCPRPAPPA